MEKARPKLEAALLRVLRFLSLLGFLTALILRTQMPRIAAMPELRTAYALPCWRRSRSDEGKDCSHLG